jgi:hypothetical protein
MFTQGDLYDKNYAIRRHGWGLHIQMWYIESLDIAPIGNSVSVDIA